MSDFKAEMHQIRFRLGLLYDTRTYRWELAQQAPADTIPTVGSPAELIKYPDIRPMLPPLLYRGQNVPNFGTNFDPIGKQKQTCQGLMIDLPPHAEYNATNVIPPTGAVTKLALKRASDDCAEMTEWHFHSVECCQDTKHSFLRTCAHSMQLPSTHKKFAVSLSWHRNMWNMTKNCFTLPACPPRKKQWFQWVTWLLMTKIT